MSYVVRIDRFEGMEPDYKVFGSLVDAKARFDSAATHVLNGDFAGAFLFSAEGISDPRQCLEAVKTGHAILIERDAKPRLDKGLEEIIDQFFKNGTDT